MIPENLSPLVEKRLFHFLNRARTARAITKVDLTKSPAPGKADYGIGETVAQRIIDKRMQLPRRRFTELSQLEGIAGLGKDKISDVIETLEIPAAEAFRRAMYNGVIFEENFELNYFSKKLADTSGLGYRSTQTDLLKSLLLDSLGDWVASDATPEHLEQLKGEIESAYVDTYSNSAEADSYAWALWFYLFDADNWFTYEQVRLPIARYLGGYFYGDEQTFHLIKGVKNSLYLKGGITVKDLPVVVNHDEQSLSLWMGQLFD
ncbi:MAG: hypothetical protein AAGA10_05160 [Bacteroidota bacterium]